MQFYLIIIKCSKLPVPLIASTLVAPYLKYYYEEVGLKIIAPIVEIGSFDLSTGDYFSLLCL